MLSKLLKITAGLALTVSVAQAVTLDFNSLSGNMSSYTSGPVTIVSTSGGTFDAVNTPNFTIGLLTADAPRSTLRANIAGGTSFVSVDLGDFNQDADTIFLEAFSAANVSLGLVTQSLASTFDGMVTLSLSASNISYVIFGSTAPSANGSSVYADNFTYGTGAATPDAGSTLALFAAGLGLLGVAARSRKSVR